jgi:hypothetical protein
MITADLTSLFRIRHSYVSGKALGKANSVFLEELLSFLQMLSLIGNYQEP